MRTLLILDRNDYSEDMPILEKYATRAMIVRDGRVATQQGAAGDYKLLGGGVEQGEDYRHSLCREVLEESGLIVIPDSIQEIGEILERRRDIFEPQKVFVCHTLFYVCDAKAQMEAPCMTQSEITKGYHLVWATPEEIMAGNAAFCDSQPWIYRDTEFVRRYCTKACEALHTDI